MRADARAMGLERLVGLPVDRFLGRYWPHRHHVHHAPLARLSHLASLPELRDIEALLRSGRAHQVRVWFYEDRTRFHHLDVSAEQALALYRGGQVTVVVDAIQRELTPVRRWLERLAHELEVPANALQCNVYASPPGVGTRAHVDHCESILVQLSGQKRWRVTPSAHPYSAVSYVAGDPTPLAWIAAPPASLRPDPSRTEEHVLRPGSAMFVPRGTWHESHTAAASFALTLSFNGLSWAQLLGAYVTQVLGREVAFREPASAAAPDAGARRSDALTKLEAARRAALDALEGLSLEDCIDAGAGPASVLPPVRFAVRSGVRLDARARLLACPGGRAIALDETTLALWRAIARRRGPFAAAEVAPPGLSPGVLARQLQALATAGALRIVTGPRRRR